MEKYVPTFIGGVKQLHIVQFSIQLQFLMKLYKLFGNSPPKK